MKQIDYRLLGITGGIVAIALTVAWMSIVLFRYLFPALAAETFLDELSGLPIAAMVTVGGQWLLLREEVFHLLLTVDMPDINIVNLQLLRRRSGLGLLFMPAYQREAIITEGTTLIRNISWWGEHGVDVCRLCFYVGDIDTPGHLLDLPRGLIHAHATINIKPS